MPLSLSLWTPPARLVTSGSQVCDVYYQRLSQVGSLQGPGKAMVRFEMMPKKLPSGEISNRVVIRVLKFIQPPNIDDKFVQKEGELLKQYNSKEETEWIWERSPNRLKWLSETSRKVLEDAYVR